ARRRSSGREGAQRDHLSLDRQLRANRVLSQLALLAEPDRRSAHALCELELAEEASDRRLAERLVDRRLERLERVAAQQVQVEPGEDVGAADVVEADEPAGDPDENAALAVEPW